MGTSEKEAIERLDAELRAAREKAAKATELADARRKRIEELEGKLDRAREAQSDLVDREKRLNDTEEDLLRTRVHLWRVQSSLPVRSWHRLRTIPPMSWIAARRAREYMENVESARRG